MPQPGPRPHDTSCQLSMRLEPLPKTLLALYTDALSRAVASGSGSCEGEQVQDMGEVWGLPERRARELFCQGACACGSRWRPKDGACVGSGKW